MIIQERANPPGAGQPPGGADDQPRQDTPQADESAALPFDYIDEALEETMIASDPPALSPRTGVGAPDHSSRPMK